MLKLRGLPFSATAHDIANWFNTGVNVFNLTAESCVAAPPSFSGLCTNSAARTAVARQADRGRSGESGTQV